MKRKPLIIAATTAAAVALAGVSVTALAQPSQSASDIDPELLEQRITELSETADAAVVAEVRDGDDTWTAAAGTREAGGDTPAEPNDNVRVGSISKTLLVTVMMQLSEEGELDLDANVNDVLPGTLPYDEAITVRQLLNHTSGVPDYFTEIYPSLAEGSVADVETNRDLEFTPEELVDAAASNPLEFEPGSDYSYSNTGYFVAGLIVEDITGNSFENEVHKRVLEPTGMDATYLPDSDHGIADPFLHQYIATGQSDERWNTTEVSPTQFWAAGVAISQAPDIDAFYRALFTGELVSDDSLTQMRDYTGESDDGYGLGLAAAPVGEQCEPVPDGIVEGHTGGTLGHTSYSFSSPDGNRQMTFTVALDAGELPQEEVSEITEAVTALQYAGLCDDAEVPNAFDAQMVSPQQARIL